MQLPQIEREMVSGAGCDLSVLQTGPADGVPVVMLHGMRDHALSMLFLAQAMPEHRLIAPDLRGHGDSDKPGAYGLLQFVADLKAVFDYFRLDQAMLIGHSLGGHIVSRFSSIYPERVGKLVMLDGMGPPGISEAEPEASADWRIERWRATVEQQLQPPASKRMMRDVHEAYERFRRNNPGLSEAHMTLLVDHGIEEGDEGVSWKWDARVDSIWTTFSHEESEAAWSGITAPVLIVTGEYALDYWAVRREHLKGQQAFYESELKRREALYRDARSLVIPGAGHMLHYDQPQLLAGVIRDFILT